MKKLTLALLSLVSLAAFCFAAETAPAKSPAPVEKPACCEKAEAKGKTCKNPCCVEAAKQGKVCEKCLKHKHHGEKKEQENK